MSDVVYGLPFSEYQKFPGINRSALAKIHECPAICHWAIKNPNYKETPSLKFGRLVHQAIFEQEEFEANVRFLPEIHGRTKDGKRRATAAEKEFEEELRAKYPTAEFVSYEDWQEIRGIARAVRGHSICEPAIRAGKAEVSLFWDWEGVPCKARLDCYYAGDIWDAKTTTDLSRFERSIFDWGYHYQAAWYLWGAQQVGLKADRFLFIAVDKEPPYCVRVVELDKETLDYAHKKNTQALKLYKKCLKENNWPGYPEKIETASLPSFLMEDFLGEKENATNNN